MFPLLALTYKLYSSGLRLSYRNIEIIYAHDLLFIMINTAPFFLGIFSFIVGNSLAKEMTAQFKADAAIRASDVLRISEVRQKTMIANISDVISIIDQNGFLIYESPNIEKWFGWLPDDILDTSVWARIHPDDLDRIQGEFYNSVANYGSKKTVEFKFKCKDGSYKDVELTAANLIHDPSIKGLLMNYHDITERKKREQEILYIGYHDVQTGLYNRAFFEEESKRLDTERQLPLSVIIGDVNGLKLTNDTFGHTQGDKILVEIANILKNCCRDEDIMARIGGDEFCILLPQTGTEVAQTICNRIHRACEDYKSGLDEEVLNPSISLGYATKTNAGELIESIIKEADNNMYKQKLLWGA
jgi:diguanylate cyclase (GGDEF)-like protein/PAS domain S-box-containing protein